MPADGPSVGGFLDGVGRRRRGHGGAMLAGGRDRPRDDVMTRAWAGRVLDGYDVGAGWGGGESVPDGVLSFRAACGKRERLLES